MWFVAEENGRWLLMRVEVIIDDGVFYGDCQKHASLGIETPCLWFEGIEVLRFMSTSSSMNRWEDLRL